MKITLPIIALVLGFALVSLPVTVNAQTPATATTAPAKDKKTKYSGTVSAVDATANTISITDKTVAPKTLAVTAATKIKKDGKAATLADIKVGDKVGGSFTTDASGALTATTIISGAKKDKAAKTTAAASTPKPAAPAAQ